LKCNGRNQDDIQVNYVVSKIQEREQMEQICAQTECIIAISSMTHLPKSLLQETQLVAISLSVCSLGLITLSWAAVYDSPKRSTDISNGWLQRVCIVRLLIMLGEVGYIPYILCSTGRHVWVLCSPGRSGWHIHVTAPPQAHDKYSIEHVV
jgi:hypothetical protein